MRQLTISLILITLLGACSSPHLEIFPEISTPSLMQEKLSVAQLHEDIDAFIAGMKARHPNFEQYANQQALEEKVAQLKTEINMPLNRLEFYRYVGQLSHLFNDGHSFLLWPYQEFNQLTQSGNKPFPFAVQISNQKLYLKHGYQLETEGLSLPRGANIQSINGRTTRELLEHMQKYMGGETRILRDNVVARRFSQALWSIYGEVNKFEVTLKIEQIPSKFVITKDQNWERVTETNTGTNSEYSFDILSTAQNKQNVGLLTINSFDVDIDSFHSFVDETFSKVRELEIGSLIIDIRENGGGNTDSTEYLTRYIADKDFRMVSRLKEKLNQDNRGLFNYRGNIGDFIDEEWTDWQSPMPEDRRYQGDTYLLIGPISYSASIVFATTLKDHQFATLIGRETGGFANQTGQGNLFNLPNSELRAYVPTRLLLRPNGDESIGGVTPDIVTQDSEEAITNGVDMDIQAALTIINKKSQIE